MGMKKLTGLIMALVLCLTAVGAMADEILEIYTLDDLIEFRDDVNKGNNYQGQTVTLHLDIDLNSEEWTPIGTKEKPFKGTFNGNNKTISNLIITSGDDYIGFFGYAEGGAIQNLTIQNAIVSGGESVGALAGRVYSCTLEKITLTGHAEVTAKERYVGGLFGHGPYGGPHSDLTVDVDSTSFVRAESTNTTHSNAGGVSGYLTEGVTVNNVSSNIDVYGKFDRLGGVFGLVQRSNTLNNVTCTGNVYFEGTDAEMAQQVGGIAGCWGYEHGKVILTISDSNFTGKIYGLPAGIVVHNNGYVGATFSGISADTMMMLNGEECYAQDPNVKSAEELSNAVTKDETTFTYLNGDVYTGLGDMSFECSNVDYKFNLARAVLKKGSTLVDQFDADAQDETRAVLEEGSVKVTLKKNYLDTLENGEYTLEIYYDKVGGMMVSGKLQVEKPVSGGNLPQTGDSSSLALWCGLMALCAGAFAVRSRKTRAN